MKIKQILLYSLVLTLPIFTWYLISDQDSLKTIFNIFGQPGIMPAFIASSILLTIGHVIRATKTKYLTDSIKKTSPRTHIRALFIGYLFNILLPFKLGEVIRALVLGKGTKMSSTFMFGLVVLDRAIDGIILGGLGLFISLNSIYIINSTGKRAIFLSSTFLMIVSTIILVLLIIIRAQPAWLLRFWHKLTALFNESVRDSLRFKLWSLMYGLDRVIVKKKMINYIIFSIGMWMVYILALFPVLHLANSELNKSQIATISTISYLGVAAPAEPLNLSSYHKFVDSFIGEESIEILAITWLLQILPALLIGLVFVLRTNETLKKPDASNDGSSIDDKLLRNVDITSDLGSFLDAFFTNNTLSKIMYRFEVDKNSKLIHYFKGGSSAITALVYENGSYLVRKITPIQYKYKLKSQYDWLKDKSSLDKVVNVLDEETTESYYKLDIEYKKEYGPYFDYIHSMPIQKSKKILSEVFAYLNKEIYKPEQLQYRPKDLNKYLSDRLLAKIRQASEVNDEIRSLLSYDTLVINGKSYSNIPNIINRIQKDNNLKKVLATYRKCSIHGDTTVDNILVDKSTRGFLLIDPTDNENEISGPVFDFGRMTQSLKYGYEFLNRDEQQVFVVDNSIDFEYSISSSYAELANHLKKLQKIYLTPEENKAVLFHAALLYSRMLTHRVVINPLNAAKYYAVSVIAFNDFMDQMEIRNAK